MDGIHFPNKSPVPHTNNEQATMKCEYFLKSYNSFKFFFFNVIDNIIGI